MRDIPYNHFPDCTCAKCREPLVRPIVASPARNTMLNQLYEIRRKLWKNGHPDRDD